jgi:L-ascorbate metabolism protein UlaG (beta-lactamase superfamily)
MKRLLLTLLAGTAVACAGLAAYGRPFTDPRSDRLESADNANATDPRDPACYAKTYVSTGGAFPRNPHTLAVRWGGFSNYELVYNGSIILLDAYYDRGSFFPPLNISAPEIRRADVLLIGHGHVDHMSDAASIGTTEKLMTQKIPASQIKTVTGKDGSVLKFERFTVEPILGRHGEPNPLVGQTLGRAINSLLPQMAPEQKAEDDEIRARGTGGPRVITEGTIAYLITLDDGFRIMYRDSGGPVTDQEKTVMQRVGGVDLALVAVSANFLPSLTAQQALEHMQVYKPDVYMPAHHDAAFAGHAPLWRATEPVFQALKDANSRLVTVSRGYREPVCFNTEVNLSQNGRH